MYLCTDLTLWTTAYEIGQITRGGGGRLFLVPPSISKTTHDLTTKMCTYMLQIVLSNSKSIFIKIYFNK